MMVWTVEIVCEMLLDEETGKWFLDCYEEDVEVWHGLSSPAALGLKRNGENFAGKDVLEIDTTRGEWLVLEERRDVEHNGKRLDMMVMQNEHTGDVSVCYGKWAGFGVPIGPNKYVLREKARKD